MPPHAHKGRGAASNPEGRFESIRHHAEDDGWQSELLEDKPRPRTEVTDERARSVISRNDSPDIHFTQALNPYRGCEHGCIYCFARPSHSYLNLSPGLDFETKLRAKGNLAEVLRLSPVLHEFSASARIGVIGAVYNLQTGRVEFTKSVSAAKSE